VLTTNLKDQHKLTCRVVYEGSKTKTGENE